MARNGLHNSAGAMLWNNNDLPLHDTVAMLLAKPGHRAHRAGFGDSGRPSAEARGKRLPGGHFTDRRGHAERVHMYPRHTVIRHRHSALYGDGPRHARNRLAGRSPLPRRQHRLQTADSGEHRPRALRLTGGSGAEGEEDTELNFHGAFPGSGRVVLFSRSVPGISSCTLSLGFSINSRRPPAALRPISKSSTSMELIQFLLLTKP